MFETHNSGTWIANFHAPLSMASSLVIFQFFRSLFIDSTHDKFGLPRPILALSAIQHDLSIRYALALLEAWRSICPNHLRWCQTIGVTQLSRISSFLTDPFLCGHIHVNMRISATPNCWTCCLLFGNILLHTTSQVESLSYRTCNVSFCGTIVTEEAWRHFFHPALIRWLTSSSISPSSCSIDP